MKALAFVSALLAFSFGFSARAMIQQPGGFAPSMCGHQVLTENQGLEYNIEQLCIGEIVGEKGEAGIPAVAFRFSGDEVLVYKIVDQVSPLVLTLTGKMQSIFYLESLNGERMIMKVYLVDGKIESAAGTLGGIEYFVTGFQPILVIQDLDAVVAAQ